VPDGRELRRLFESTGGFTVGLEEEAMLLDPETGDLAPVAARLLERLDGDPRFKPELPAAHLELVTGAHDTVSAALAELTDARRQLAAAAAGLARPAVAGVHPVAAPYGELSRGERYDALREEFGPIAEQQLVASLQVHVAVGGAERSLAVYNGLRCLLPELTALAANAPFHAGRDTGLATVRPTISQLLPRQGVPPRLESWEHFAAELAWAAAAGSPPSRWWWELRPHPRFGTLELRVPDAQTTLREAAGLSAFAHALVAWLAERFDDGEPLPDAASWRIAENRSAALRHGLDAQLLDLETGERRPARERLLSLLDAVTPPAGQLGAQLLEETRALVARNGAIRQREVAQAQGISVLPGWLADRFLTEVG
jgi:carboxylate-amine ligase